ncbi:MAG: (Fe-S)-binding protein [Syntrophomonadaceae bacterium]|nr:(Fe-S)-binding protein [Syntrophomonadaceae bacterium]
MKFRELPPVRDQLRKCVRCGRCRTVCPVFAEVKNETVAPRGHVFMVQMLRDGVVQPSSQVYEHLGNCLLCETCSTFCPSGIDIHELNAAARSYVTDSLPSAGRRMVFDRFWTSPRLLRTFSWLAWAAQATGLQSLARKLGLTRLLPGDLPEAERILEEVPRRAARELLGEFIPARGQRRWRVGYFLGCATNLFNPEVASATVEVLTRNGCDVYIPSGLKCCGLPQVANGRLDTARELLLHNMQVFAGLELDYVVTDCASCSSALSAKHMAFVLGVEELDREAAAFAGKVQDLTAFLVDVLDVQPPAAAGAGPLPITYHDPCHLAKAQGIRRQPRELLRRIPGVELVEMKDADRCCGGSGTFSLTHYAMSMKILDKKMQAIAATGARTVATCCPSCMMQLRHGMSRSGREGTVLHPVTLLAEAYRQSDPSHGRA